VRISTPFVAALCLAAGVAHAQYKVIGPDGRVTYTDRAPTSTEGGRVVPLREKDSAAQPEVAFPTSWRRCASKYPVTLYVATGSCDPCTAGRQMLRQRGIPYTEKTVTTIEDSEALQKLSGGREAPTLAIGTQVLRGFASDTWGSYLDAAGYPKESRLPAAWQPRPPTPVVARAVETPRPAARTPALAPASPVPTPPPPASGSIRF
jgi:glutaredoxin